jgi:argininosuccinate lyase
MDLLLAPYDILGSIAHATMLQEIGYLNYEEFLEIRNELIKLYHKSIKDEITIDSGLEDIHSQVEIWLTDKLGEAGKRIHTARSRNDQVLLDIKLYIRNEIKQVVSLAFQLFQTLQSQSEQTKDILLPGYTHLQIAMPSSFGLWFGAYAESLVDDMELLLSAYRITNQNPLGSAAGYGSSFPINRKRTTELLGFDSMNYNVVYAQMGRGKVEKIVAFAISSVATTLSKMANDACLFASQNFGFIIIPDEFTTGSSIMPHKKNPDVFELLRAKCNKIQSIPFDIGFIANNLSSGYFRDFQVIKQIFLPAFSELKNCILMADLMVGRIQVNTQILNKEIYQHIFSVEAVNSLVEKGMPFREAYRKIADEIEKDTFHHDQIIKHVHDGSMGNLCNDIIAARMDDILDRFNFKKVNNAIDALLNHRDE